MKKAGNIKKFPLSQPNYFINFAFIPLIFGLYPGLPGFAGWPLTLILPVSIFICAVRYA